MMARMLILHGEHELNSRARLIELISAAKQNGTQVIWLDGKKLTTADLELALGSDTLFANPKLLVIEQVFAGPKSKRKDEVAKALGQISDQTVEVFLWEAKTITATQLKTLGNPKQEIFKLSNAVFTWLDAVSPAKATKAKQQQLFTAAVAAESAEFCLIMLIRQLRLLIQAKENKLTSLPPFMIGKIKKQADAFTLEQLLSLHAAVFGIDKRQKTGTSPSNTCQELEVLLARA